MYWYPRTDLTGKFPIWSVRILWVSSCMLTCTLLHLRLDGWGWMSSFTSKADCFWDLVDNLFFLWWSRWPKIVGVGARMCYFTFVVLMWGHVARWFCFTAHWIVCVHGKLQALYKNLVSFSALVLGAMQLANFILFLISFLGSCSSAVVVSLLFKSKYHSLILCFLVPWSTILLLWHM